MCVRRMCAQGPFSSAMVHSHMRTGIYVVIIVMKIINVNDCNFHDVNENEYTLTLALSLALSLFIYASRVDICERTQRCDYVFDFITKAFVIDMDG